MLRTDGGIEVSTLSTEPRLFPHKLSIWQLCGTVLTAVWYCVDGCVVLCWRLCGTVLTAVWYCVDGCVVLCWRVDCTMAWTRFQHSDESSFLHFIVADHSCRQWTSSLRFFLIEISHPFAPLLCFSLLGRHGGHCPGSLYFFYFFFARNINCDVLIGWSYWVFSVLNLLFQIVKSTCLALKCDYS